MYFSNAKKLRKSLSITLAICLACTLLAGCFGGPNDSTVPSDESDSFLPNLSETTDPTATDPVDTVPEETQLVNENTGTVTQQVVIRSNPSRDAYAKGNLAAGDRVEILQQQTAAGYTWGYITSPETGWIVMDYVEMDIPSDDPNASDTTTPAGSQEGSTGSEGSSDNESSSNLNLKGVVTGNTLNIRKTPSGEIIGGYSKGDVITILEISDGWGRTSDGWVSLDYVNTSGSTGSSGTDSGDDNTSGNGSTSVIAKGIVIAKELNIRADATKDSDRVGSLSYGARVEIYEKSGNWGRTKDGWISLSYVYQDGTTGTNTAAGIVDVSTTLHIRSGPGTNYTSVGSYAAGEHVTILEQFTYGDVTWGCTSKGWISMDYVRLDGTDSGESKTGTVNADELNIRSGPGTNYSSVGALYFGDVVTILYEVTVGDTTWGNIDEGWISMTYVDLD